MALDCPRLCPVWEPPMYCQNLTSRCDLLNHFSHAQGSVFAKIQGGGRHLMCNGAVRFEYYVKKYKGPL